MNTSDRFDRLRAFGEGRPLPRSETLSFPRVADAERLVIAFVRMSGESSPWGVALGAPDQSPACFTVPEPRNADLHAVMARAMATAVLAHVGHPRHIPPDSHGLPEATRPFPTELLRARQLWLPGPSHLEMLHFLDYRYTLSQSEEALDLKTLRALGRACGWLFRESTRPGQVRVHDASARLREAFAFPAEPQRQQHLGFLMAWLRGGDRDVRRQRAREAEALTVGVTLNPGFERDALVELVGKYNAASTPAEKTQRAEVIHQALLPELMRRWTLTVEALRALEADPRKDNPQLDPVVSLGAEECQYQYFVHEQSGLRENLSTEERRNLGSHPETDFSPARAARRYFMHLHAHELSISELVHGDNGLLERAMDAGDGFRGTVTAVTKTAVQGRSRTRWTITTGADETLRLREESGVCMVGARKRTGAIVSVTTEGKLRTLVVELTEGLTRKALPEIAPADAQEWVGQTVRFLDKAAVGISLRKGINVYASEGPGAWLTHAAPLPEPSPAGLIRPDLVDLVKTLEK